MIRSTIYIDGEEIPEGSTRAVVEYEKILRDAQRSISETSSSLLGIVPDDVADEWRKSRDKIQKLVDAHAQAVSRFARDFEQLGLERAVSEAQFRKELSAAAGAGGTPGS
jgi:hypothetical protein